MGDRLRIGIPFPKRQNRKKGSVIGPKQVPNLARQISLDLKAQEYVFRLNVLPSKPNAGTVSLHRSAGQFSVKALPSKTKEEATRLAPWVYGSGSPHDSYDTG